MEIACIIGQGFEDAEFRVPYDRLRQAGHHVLIIGAEANQRVEGKQGDEQIETDMGIDDARIEDFDVLFIPGGHSPDKLRADARFVDFVRRFDESGKLIVTLCHGPQLLMTADRVKGRKMTAWETIQKDLELAGADVVDREVVVEGNLITSRNPGDLDAFSKAVLDRIGRPREGSAGRVRGPEAGRGRVRRRALRGAPGRRAPS